MRARQSVLAGSWYPATAAACEREILSFLDDPNIQAPAGAPFVAGIVPHAGWYFSGSIACNVIRALAGTPPPEVIVIFGMHLHAGSPRYIMADGQWETPFGNLPIDSRLAGELVRRFDFTIEEPGRYSQENTIELQLPFIKYFCDQVRIVPVGVPPVASSLEIGIAAVEAAEGLGRKLAVLGSTDLTHYGANYGFTPKGSGPGAVDWVRKENDRQVIDAMLAMDPPGVIRESRAHQNACCAGAAATAIAAAGRLGAKKATPVAYATSYDKHPGDSFVGYAGIVFGRT